MPGWVSRFSLGGGQRWFMGKEKLAAGPDVPAFPLFLQPPERCSLFSFPDGQEESDGGNCHCLITAQGPLYDGRHGRERGSAAAGREGRAGRPGLPFAPGFGGWLRVGREEFLYRPPQRCLKDSQGQEAIAHMHYIGIFFFFLVRHLSWWKGPWMGRGEAWKKTALPRSETRRGFSSRWQ